MPIAAKIRRFMTCAALLALAAAPVAAAPVLSPGSIWEYTFSDPTADPSWNTTTGGWLTGPAPFGNHTGGYPGDPLGYFDYATSWPANSVFGYDLWVRRSVNLTGFNPSSALWNLGVDNGFALYANGALVAAHNAEGYTYRWEYSGNFPGGLNPGLNVIALQLEDHGGLTAFDMEITGDRSAPVPEPGTMVLLGTGVVGLASRAWRKRRG